MSPVGDPAAEAVRYGRYLVGNVPRDAVVQWYVEALPLIDPAPSERDRRQLRLVHRWPALLGLVDGGLALLGRDASLRRRLLLMAALLECTPEHADRFLVPTDRDLSWSRAIASAVRGGIRGVLGVLVVVIL